MPGYVDAPQECENTGAETQRAVEKLSPLDQVTVAFPTKVRCIGALPPQLRLYQIDLSGSAQVCAGELAALA